MDEKITMEQIEAVYKGYNIALSNFPVPNKLHYTFDFDELAAFNNFNLTVGSSSCSE